METRYVTNETGERVGVILSIEEYERIMDELEDLEATAAYDRAAEEIERGEEPIPWEKVRDDIGSEYGDPHSS